MFWIAIARITNRLSPARSEAKAVPNREPLGEAVDEEHEEDQSRGAGAGTGAPHEGGREGPAANGPRPAAQLPTASPPSTARVEPSSVAGINRPAIDATPITPAAKPRRSGVSWAARDQERRPGSPRGRWRGWCRRRPTARRPPPACQAVRSDPTKTEGLARRRRRSRPEMAPGISRRSCLHRATVDRR